MPTRNGKIANLPNDIREQLNLRLLEGETGRDLAAWLNGLPAVQSILTSQFNASPISEVNLTLWRQGGYLQWFTERECFDSARAFAYGDCKLAKTGFSAERLLSVLTVRFGQLLMYWDSSPDDGVSENAAFFVMARKARILLGICRSVLAIHRIQSQSALQKSEPMTSSPNSRSRSEKAVSPSAATLGSLVPQSRAREARRSESIRPAPPPVPKSVTSFASIEAAIRRGRQSRAGGPSVAGEIAGPPLFPVSGLHRGERRGAGGGHGDSRANPVSVQVLSGPIAAWCVPANLPHTPFRRELDPTDILDAV